MAESLSCLSEETVVESDTVDIEESYPDTVPKWKTMFTAILDEWSGYCTSLDCAISLIREYLKPYLTKTRFYLKKTHHQNFGRTEIPKKVVIQWDDNSQMPSIIPYDGAPFIYLNMKIWACHVSMSKCQSFAAKNTAGCPAQIIMKEVLKFPDYQVREDNDSSRGVSMERLKRDFAFRTAQGERRFYVRLPSPGQHANHTVEGDLFMWNPVNKEVMRKLRELLEEGFETIEELQKQIYSFVRNEMPFGTDISDHNRSYFPTINTIKNAILAFKREEKQRSNSAKMEAEKEGCDVSSSLRPFEGDSPSPKRLCADAPGPRAASPSHQTMSRGGAVSEDITVEAMINDAPAFGSSGPAETAPDPEVRLCASAAGNDPAAMNRRIKVQLNCLLQAFGTIKDAELLSTVHSKLADCVALVQQHQQRQRDGSFTRQTSGQVSEDSPDGHRLAFQRRKRKVYRSNGRRPEVLPFKRDLTDPNVRKSPLIAGIYNCTSVTTMASSLEHIDAPPILAAQKASLEVSDIVYMSPSDVERLEASTSHSSLSSTALSYGCPPEANLDDPSGGGEAFHVKFAPHSFGCRTSGDTHNLCDGMPPYHYGNAQHSDDDFEDDEAAYMSYFGDDRRKQ